MKNNSGESVGFSFRAALWFPATVILLCETSVIDFSETYNSTFLSFSPSSVMILLSFLSFFSFFFVKNQITYFQKRRNLPNLTNGHVAR